MVEALKFYADWNNWNSGKPLKPDAPVAIHHGCADFEAKIGRQLAPALVDHGEKARAALRSERAEGESIELCEGCPPVGYPTDKTRCTPCPRGPAPEDGNG